MFVYAQIELVDKGSLKEETFSPFDLEKHQKKLADMKKSPAHPNFYPAKRAFAEVKLCSLMLSC
jgi:hypothetical protein